MRSALNVCYAHACASCGAVTVVLRNETARRSVRIQPRGMQQLEHDRVLAVGRALTLRGRTRAHVFIRVVTSAYTPVPRNERSELQPETARPSIRAHEERASDTGSWVGLVRVRRGNECGRRWFWRNDAQRFHGGRHNRRVDVNPFRWRRRHEHWRCNRRSHRAHGGDGGWHGRHRRRLRACGKPVRRGLLRDRGRRVRDTGHVRNVRRWTGLQS
jgi:hypothetical protein